MEKKQVTHRIVMALVIGSSLSLMLFVYRYFSTPPKEPIAESAAAQTVKPDEPLDSNIDSEPPPKIATADEAAPSAKPEPEPAPEEPIDPSFAFSNRVFLLSQQRRMNSETFITREDLPDDLRQQLDLALEEYKRKGHFSVEESYIEEMDAPYNAVEPFRLDDPALVISAEKLDESSLADMEYVGVIPDRISDADDAPVPGIRRVFKHEAGYVSLYEADLKTSEALLQKEFVNKSIKGYPATQITYCAPSMRCVTELSWLTNDKRYELSLRGDIKELGEDELVTIASSLDLPPVPQNEE